MKSKVAQWKKHKRISLNATFSFGERDERSWCGENIYDIIAWIFIWYVERERWDRVEYEMGVEEHGTYRIWNFNLFSTPQNPQQFFFLLYHLTGGSDLCFIGGCLHAHHLSPSQTFFSGWIIWIYHFSHVHTMFITLTIRVFLGFFSGFWEKDNGKEIHFHFSPLVPDFFLSSSLSVVLTQFIRQVRNYHNCIFIVLLVNYEWEFLSG